MTLSHLHNILVNASYHEHQELAWFGVGIVTIYFMYISGFHSFVLIKVISFVGDGFSYSFVTGSWSQLLDQFFLNSVYVSIQNRPLKEKVCPSLCMRTCVVKETVKTSKTCVVKVKVCKA